MFAVVCNRHRLKFVAIKRKFAVYNSLSDLCVADRCRNQITFNLFIKGNVGKSADFNDAVCRNRVQNGLRDDYVYYESACLIRAAYLCRPRILRDDFAVYDSRNPIIIGRVVYRYIVRRLSVFRNVYNGRNCRCVTVDCIGAELRTVTADRRVDIYHVKHYTGIDYRHVYNRTRLYARVLDVHNVFRRAIRLCREQNTVGVVCNRYNVVLFAVGNGTAELRFGCTIGSLVDKFREQQIVVADCQSNFVGTDGKYRRNVTVDNQHHACCLTL